MSKRLQVLLADEEMADIRMLAQREHVTVGEWVRRTLRDARSHKSLKDPAFKLAAIRRAAECSFPEPEVDIDQMLREIEQGYLS
jgi:succinylarginine dihydrolase